MFWQKHSKIIQLAVFSLMATAVIPYINPVYAGTWGSYVNSASRLAYSLITYGTIVAIAWLAIKAMWASGQQAQKYWNHVIMLLFALVAFLVLPIIVDYARGIGQNLKWDPSNLK